MTPARQSQQPKEPTCTTKCPAIRDDKGTWYCRIMKACVAPSEHHFEYGFDVVKEGKITHSGYSTPCDAMGLFSTRPHTSVPAPAAIPQKVVDVFINELIKSERAEAAKDAREQVLEVFAEVEYLHGVDGITYPDLYNEFIQRYKSLRHRQEPQREGRR